MIRISGDARFVEEDNGGIILHIGNDRFYGLNATGTVIWRHLAVGESVSQITEFIAAETSSEVATVQHELIEFMDHLSRLGLVTIEPDAECGSERMA